LQLAPGGALRDIAPTLLGILGETAPKDMTGRDLRVLNKT
jgi:bisphosphoglycerate-independent phosphoglycerate mutase (AlkP superfamily)